VAEEFKKVIEGINQEFVDIRASEGKINISTEGSKEGYKIKSSFSTQEGIDISEVIDIKKAAKNKIELPGDFREAISLCMFSASKDLTKPAMSCIYIDGRWVASTDNYRISEYKMASALEHKGGLLLPAHFVALLVKFEKIEWYSRVGNWICFFSESGAAFCFTTFEEEFPQYSKLFKDGFTGKEEIIFPKDAKETAMAASILCEGDDLDKAIKVEIHKNKMRCRGENTHGWIESENKIDYKGEKISFAVNPNFFCSILKHTNKMTCGENKVLFQDAKFRHLLMLHGE
jgi:DNA polymerase III sliding clamp (beta) subunit (PCNA family)